MFMSNFLRICLVSTELFKKSKKMDVGRFFWNSVLKAKYYICNLCVIVAVGC